MKNKKRKNHSQTAMNLVVRELWSSFPLPPFFFPEHLIALILMSWFACFLPRSELSAPLWALQKWKCMFRKRKMSIFHEIELQFAGFLSSF